MNVLENLWNIESPTPQVFDPFMTENLPIAARNYITRAIAAGTPIASAVRLEMKGEIKLNNQWLPFEATQVVRNNHGFVWRAHVIRGMAGISGYDRLIDGEGEMKWKVLGLIPVMTAHGPDITRSTAGRMATEYTLLPSAQLDPKILWKELSETSVSLRREIAGIETDLTLEIEKSGTLKSASLNRWGNPDGNEFQNTPFGAELSEEVTYGGYTIPTKICAGWQYGTSHFDEGEFFRAEITSGEFK
ncbi:MAG: DUF6544 family protein [Armatimonadota bacterium]